MDLDRTSLGDGAQDLRARSNRIQERMEQPPEVAPTVRPAHGGVPGAERTNEQLQSDADRSAGEQRRSALDALARFLSLPGQNEVEIDIDADTDKPVFKIRDRRTGEVVREIPEPESRSLMQKLRELSGALVNRSL